MDDRWRPTPLEIAGGVALGSAERPAGWSDAAALGRTETPTSALESVILPHLTRTPCLVTFSGGRDSSLVLAASLRTARRHGLPEPIAVTNRYPGAAGADEDCWQELVIRHLRPREWVKIDRHDDSDVVGPIAARSLRRHGLLWPPLLHSHESLRELAAGGVVLTGEGGDAWLGERRIAAVRYVLGRRGVVPRRQVRRVAPGFVPNPVKRRWLERSLLHSTSYDWVRPDPRRELIRRVAADATSEPLRWDRSLDWLTTLRAWRAAAHSRQLVGQDHDMEYADVLQHPRFVASLQAAGGALGFLGRTEVLNRLFPHLLPKAVIARQTKALFDEVYFHRHTREFVRTWNGDGLDDDLVDAARLSRLWSVGSFSTHTLLLLQAAWLGANGARSTAGDEE